MEAEFEREVLDRLIKIEEKLDGYNNAKVKTYENEKAILRIQNDLEDVTTKVDSLEISIHAPARGATSTYQHTHYSTRISIHAPARGATDFSDFFKFFLREILNPGNHDRIFDFRFISGRGQ